MKNLLIALILITALSSPAQKTVKDYIERQQEIELKAFPDPDWAQDSSVNVHKYNDSLINTLLDSFDSRSDTSKLSNKAIQKRTDRILKNMSKNESLLNYTLMMQAMDMVEASAKSIHAGRYKYKPILATKYGNDLDGEVMLWKKYYVVCIYDRLFAFFHQMNKCVSSTVNVDSILMYDLSDTAVYAHVFNDALTKALSNDTFKAKFLYTLYEFKYGLPRQQISWGGVPQQLYISETERFIEMFLMGHEYIHASYHHKQYVPRNISSLPDTLPLIEQKKKLFYSWRNELLADSLGQEILSRCIQLNALKVYLKEPSFFKQTMSWRKYELYTGLLFLEYLKILKRFDYAERQLKYPFIKDDFKAIDQLFPIAFSSTAKPNLSKLDSINFSSNLLAMDHPPIELRIVFLKRQLRNMLYQKETVDENNVLRIGLLMMNLTLELYDHFEQDIFTNPKGVLENSKKYITNLNKRL